MLKFDYELVEGREIRRVVGTGRQIMNDSSVNYERVAFELEGQCFLIHTNEDTDELEIALAESGSLEKEQFLDIPELAECVGKELGWCWEGRNYRGYFDFFAISIRGPIPDYCFLGIASSVEIGKIASNSAKK